MYCSILRPGELLIGDDNFGDHLRYFADGEERGRGLEPRDYAADPFGSFAAPFSLPLIPRSEWRERIADMEASKTRLSDLMDRAGVPCKDQRSTSYCWIFAATSAVEAVRVLQGEPFISLSPASAGAPIKGYRNQGGWSTQGVRWIAEHGLVPTALWPDTAISRQYDNEESRAERPRFRVREWMEFSGFDALATCLLSRIPIAAGYNWWGHAVINCDLVALDGGDNFGVRIRNSWGADWGDRGYSVLTGRKMYPDDAVAPHTATPTQPK